VTDLEKALERYRAHPTEENRLLYLVLQAVDDKRRRDVEELEELWRR
jgi:hypothetical protein